MTEPDRSLTRRLAQEAIARGEPSAWFERLYAAAGGDPAVVPWADRVPHPLLVEWAREAAPRARGQRALVVGCGLGDDAEELARRGYAVTAFDISPTAIAWAKKRFKDSPVDYRVADLFAPPAEWTKAFDLVLEVYTLQALPAGARRALIPRIASFVKPNGRLLVITRIREPHEPEGALPWPLTRDELKGFADSGLAEVSLKESEEADDDGAVRRWLLVYRSTAT